MPGQPHRVVLQLFGAPALTVEGQPLKIRSSRKVFELLGRIALAAPKGLDRDAAALDLWPELTLSEGRAELRRNLSYLNEAVSAHGFDALVLRDGPRLRLHDGLEVDLTNFLQDEGSPEERWPQGEFLSTLDGSWIVPERERLGRLVRRRVLARCRVLRESAPERALQMAERLAATDPFDEETASAVMELRANSGDVAGALHAFRAFEERLRRDLSVEPSAPIRALHDRLAARHSVQGLRHGFPLLTTTFVGREAEVASASDALAVDPILTFIGPPGVGKTRLCVRVAEAWSERQRAPAFFVDVTGCADGAAIADRILAVLTRDDAATQVAAPAFEDVLAARNLLIVLDNCEHAVAAAREAASRALHASRELRILATSRVALGMPGEVLWSVEPLESASAAALFLDRARLVRPRLHVDAHMHEQITVLCRQLDGLPLAIELAAARLRSDSLLRLVGTHAGRRPSLRATFESSLAPLEPRERELFRQLGIFRGGFTLADAAELVAQDEAQTEPLLARLVDYSLVRAPAVSEAHPRYTMLAPLLEFARDLLAEAGELEALAERHARLFANRYVSQFDRLVSDRVHEFSPAIEAEFDNVRSALETLLRDGADPQLGAKLCRALQRIWFVEGHVVEGAHWAERAATLVDGELRMSMETLRAMLAQRQNDYRDTARRYAALVPQRESLGEIEGLVATRLALGGCLATLGDLGGAELHARATLEEIEREEAEVRTRTRDVDLSYYRACANSLLGIVAQHRGDAVAAEESQRLALREFERIESPQGLSMALTNLGVCALQRGDYESAAELGGASLRQAEIARSPAFAAAAECLLAQAALLRADVGSARAFARAALPKALRANDYERLVDLFEIAARAAAMDGASEPAVRLLGVADTLRERAGVARQPFDERFVATILREAGRRLDAARCRSLMDATRVLPNADALALLRECIDPAEIARIRPRSSS